MAIKKHILWRNLGILSTLNHLLNYIIFLACLSSWRVFQVALIQEEKSSYEKHSYQSVENIL